jgi:DNA polymerase-1
MCAMDGRILIVDGHNTFIRSWAVVPTLDSNGEHVGGITGFLGSLRARMADVRPELVIVVWDGKGGSSKRRGVLAEYKAGRRPHTNRKYDFEESPEEGRANLQMQHLKIRSYLKMIGVIQIEIDDIEADDVIGFLCQHLLKDRDKVVVSSDKDFLQLIDCNTLVYSPSKKDYYTRAKVKQEYGVLSENFVYLKALMGDASDNIGNIRPEGSKQGFGLKTSVKLFPFLGEKESSVQEIVEYARTKSGPKYRAVVEQKDRLAQNVELMQLRIPIISAQSVAKIRGALERDIPSFVMSEFKISLLRDGMQIMDPDMFNVFGEYNVRRQKSRSKKNEH